jgi:cell division protein FtsB
MSSPAVQVRSRVPRLAEAAVARARLTVVPRRRVRAARVPFVTLVSLLLLGGVIGLLLFNTSMQQASFASTALEEQAANLTARQQTLEQEIEKLRDPQRVAADAQRLGMVLPSSPAYLNLADGSVTGVATPALPGNRLRIYAQPPVKPALIDPKPVVHTVPAPAEGQPLDQQGHVKSHDASPDTSTR